MKSVMTHSFAEIPEANIPRSKFDRSHGYKTTFDAGYLIPVFLDEALPGDTFNLHMSSFARLATPLHLFIVNLFLDSFFFAVPYRLVWNNWQKFNGEQIDPDDSTSYVVPTMEATAVTGYEAQSLHDYMGLPTGIPDYEHISLFHRAYNLIWNEWFRDQNLQDSVVVDRDDGPDSPTDYVLLRRGKRHDYFTSSLPFPQKGPSVELPLGTEAPIMGLGVVNRTYGTAGQAVYETGDTSTTTYAFSKSIDPASANTGLYVRGTAAADGILSVYADLSSATAATINQLRQAFQIQKMYERDARGGTRYVEIIRAHFNVVSPDFRLQRPEYLGGGSTPINIHPVPQTTPKPAAGTITPQGNLAAFGTASISGHGFTKSFTEHCLIIGLVSARADLNYQQGINRMFRRRTRDDFFWPEYAHLGEQAVLSEEIYIDGTAGDQTVFCYQERYSEMRYKPSIITGKLRSSDPGTLDSWHLALNFASRPTLNQTFIEDQPPFARVVAVPSEPNFIFDGFFDYTHTRPMPTYSVPGMIDHF